jgi:TatD DNase family protein
VVHCFTGGWKWAERFLELGYFLGITGMVTFPKLTEVHEVARRIPLDRLLLETDGPYLAPIPFRGKRNEPGYVPLIARKVAELRAIDPEQVALATSASATRLFARQ